MKLPSLAAVPWDMCVILTITLGGFGFSANRLMQEHRIATETVLSMDDSSDSVGGAFAGTVLDMGCVDTRAPGRVSSQQAALRLRGKLCTFTRKELKQFSGLSLRNVSTGSESTVFFHGSQSSFVSDVLPLQTGRNVIQLEWKDSVGKKRTLVTEVIGQ